MVPETNARGRAIFFAVACKVAEGALGVEARLEEHKTANMFDGSCHGVAFGNAGWSPKMSLSQDCEDTVMWMPQLSGDGLLSPLLVRISQSTNPAAEASKVITITDATRVPPFKVQNRSSLHSVWFGQVGTSCQQKLILRPGTWTSFVWPDPNLPHEIVSGIVSGEAQNPETGGPWGEGVRLKGGHKSSRVYNLNEIGEREPLKRKLDFTDGAETVVLETHVYAETDTMRVLAFMDSNGEGWLGNNIDKKIPFGLDGFFSFSDAATKKRKGATTIKEHEGLSLKNIAMHFEFPGVGIALIGEAPMCDSFGDVQLTETEVLSLSVEKMGMFSRAGEEKLEFNVGRFQVDNMQNNVRFPMMVGPRYGMADPLQYDQAPKMFSLKVFALPGSNFLFYRLMRAELAEMRVNMVVDTLFDMFESITVAIDKDTEGDTTKLSKQHVSNICSTCLEVPIVPMSPFNLFFANLEIVGSEAEAMDSRHPDAPNFEMLPTDPEKRKGEVDHKTGKRMDYYVKEDRRKWEDEQLLQGKKRRLLPFDVRVRFKPPKEKDSLHMICGRTIGNIMEGVGGTLELPLSFGAFKAQHMSLSPYELVYVLFTLPSILPTFRPSFLPTFCPSCFLFPLPLFLPFYCIHCIPSFLPSFLPAFLPSSLP